MKIVLEWLFGDLYNNYRYTYVSFRSRKYLFDSHRYLFPSSTIVIFPEFLYAEWFLRKQLLPTIIYILHNPSYVVFLFFILDKPSFTFAYMGLTMATSKYLHMGPLSLANKS